MQQFDGPKQNNSTFFVEDEKEFTDFDLEERMKSIEEVAASYLTEE